MTDVSVREVATMAGGVPAEMVEEAVTALDAAVLLPYLIRLDSITTLVGKWKKVIEARLVLEGRVGERFADPITSHTFAFIASSRGDFQDIPGLLRELDARHIDYKDAVSGLRVTNLREVARNDDDALRIIEDYYSKKVGPPHISDLDNPYIKKAIAAKKEVKA